MSKVFFLGSVIPADHAEISDAFSYAGNASQLGMIAGMREAGLEFDSVISYVPNRVFPLGRSVFYAGGEFLSDGVKFYCPAYLNVPFLREFSFNVYAFLYLFFLVKPGDVIVSYNLTIPSGFVPWLLGFFRKVRTFALAYDIHIPGETVPNTLKWRKELLKHRFLLPRFDGVVAINSKIVDDFELQKSLIVEGGIAQMPTLESKVDLLQHSDFTVVYAGRLTVENGISLLLDAIAKFDRVDVKFIIMGDGPLRASVIDAAHNDTRICYLGLLPHAEVIKQYALADLLLCIRLSKVVDTRYFFPSKLIEYMATGVPVLSTRVPGASFVLADYVFILNDEDVESLAERLEYLYLRSREGGLGIGEKAKGFVERYFLWSCQGRRIKNFIDRT